MRRLDGMLNRLVFSATTDAIDPEDRERLKVETCSAGIVVPFELWGFDFRRTVDSDFGQRWVILKFPGTGGRAERSRLHPAEFFSEDSVSGVWAVNPPGYGTSGGQPTLRTMPDVIAAAVDRVKSLEPGAKLLVTGNSLGCLWALYAGAHCGADALLLRNPFPLKELVAGRWRYNWWNFGAARYLANAVPQELDAIGNARKCNQPVMVVQSERDRLIPPRYQQMVIDGLSGPSETLVIPDADHGDPVPEDLHESYRKQFESLFAKS